MNIFNKNFLFTNSIIDVKNTEYYLMIYSILFNSSCKRRKRLQFRAVCARGANKRRVWEPRAKREQEHSIRSGARLCVLLSHFLLFPQHTARQKVCLCHLHCASC